MHTRGACNHRRGKRETGAQQLTSFRPVVTRTILTEDKVVGAEKGTERTRTDRVHGSGLEIDQDCTRNVLVGLYFIIVDIDTLKLEIVGAFVETVTVDTVLVRDDLPELGTNLVTALSIVMSHRYH